MRRSSSVGEMRKDVDQATNWRAVRRAVRRVSRRSAVGARWCAETQRPRHARSRDECVRPPVQARRWRFGRWLGCQRQVGGRRPRTTRRRGGQKSDHCRAARRGGCHRSASACRRGGRGRSSRRQAFPPTPPEPRRESRRSSAGGGWTGGWQAICWVGLGRVGLS